MPNVAAVESIWGPHAVAAVRFSLGGQGTAMLALGVIVLFVASRVLSTVLPCGRLADQGIGLRAVAYFLPIAAASLIAMLLGRPEIALGVVFGTSVGALTTVVGFVALAGPVEGGPARWRRLWPFGLIAALLVFVGGLGGTLKWREAVGLLTEGLLLLSLWADRSEEVASSAPVTPGDVLDEAVAPASARPAREPGRNWAVLAVELALTAALLWLGGVMAAQGAVRVAEHAPRLSPGAIAGSVVSLALIMPMTYGQWRRSAGGRGWAGVTTQFGVVMLNLCALLPALILIPYLAHAFPEVGHFAGTAFAEVNDAVRPLVLPVTLWRVDTVLLIVVGVLLLPVALGKWSLGREEGMILVAAYFFYLVVTVASGAFH